MDVALKPHQRRSVQFLSHDLKRKRQCGVETWVETWLGKEKKKRKKSECQWCLNKQHDVCEQHHRSGFNPRLLHVFEQDSVIIQDFKDVLWSAGLICSLSLTMCDIYKWALLFLLMIHIQYALFMYLINESEVLYVFWAVFFFFSHQAVCICVPREKWWQKSLNLGGFQRHVCVWVHNRATVPLVIGNNNRLSSPGSGSGGLWPWGEPCVFADSWGCLCCWRSVLDR